MMKKVAIILLIVITLLLVPVAIAKQGGKRLIAHTDSDIDKFIFKFKDCNIVHELKDATALDCPDEVASKLKIERNDVEDDQILWIVDGTSNTQIKAEQVWALGFTGSGVTIAVLDTGITAAHPELVSSSVGGKSFVSYTTSFADDHGHGTHVAGIITSDGINNAFSKGAAPNAGVWAGKVCGATGSCFSTDIAAGIEFVVLGPDGLTNTGDEPAKVLSISIGGGGTNKANCDGDFLAQKVNWAVANGVTAVIAAGNTAGRITSPGCASGAIAVGAVDKFDVRAGFSGTGNALDIMAPGVSIFSTVPVGYASFSGTSMATPHVSAVVALLRQANPILTDAQIKNALFSTAVDLGAVGFDTLYGWGRVNALAAFQSIVPDTTPPVISNIAVSPKSSSALITWTTNEAATSRVDYGLTAAYGSFVSNPTLVTSHSITLTGLTAATLHHFKVTSVDAAGNSASSADLTFTTTAPPTLVSILVTPINPSIIVGSTQQFTATGTFSDGTTTDLTNTAVWASSNTAVATISATGLATALSAGTTTISATSGAVTGSTTLTVTTTTPPDIVIIQKAQFKVRDRELRVQATSTNTAAVLTLVGYGTMTNLGGGNYEFRAKGVADPGAIVTVTSSKGGSATAPVQRV